MADVRRGTGDRGRGQGHPTGYFVSHSPYRPGKVGTRDLRGWGKQDGVVSGPLMIDKNSG